MNSKYVYDIETLKCCFVVLFYNKDTSEWKEFEISEYNNNLYDLVKFYNNQNIEAVIGYNNLSFDTQVMEYVIASHESWFDKKGVEICNRIYSFVQKLIEDRKYNVRLPYFISTVPQIDCFTILGLDNEARMTSLKSLEFNLDMPSVETMPIHHSVEHLTVEQILEVISYCKNDILCTDSVYELILGNTNHPIHKGKNLIELRESIREEYGLDCLNYSDIKIGDELMKHTYAKSIRKKVSDLPKKGTFRKYIKMSDCIPEYISFETDVLKRILKELQRTTLTFDSEWEKTFKIGSTKYIQGLGGLHSINENEVYIADDNHMIITCDVSSMYPASIINNSYYPAHLGVELLKTYKQLYLKRLELKPLSKTDKKAKGIADALKLTLNSFFGKLGSMESWTYDKKTLLSVTLTGQYSLLMLIEKLEQSGFKVIIANTDGIETIVPVSRKDEYYSICSEWEKLTDYTLEYDNYKCIYMLNVNNYLAITESGSVKKKGVFATDLDLWKNKSMRVRALALEQYFVNGMSPEKFIKSHTNIFDFCMRAKANSGATIKLAYDDGTEKNVGSLVRYYITSNPNDPQIFKYFDGKLNPTNQIAPNDLGVRRGRYFNNFENKQDYEIDYNQYVYETYKIISLLENNSKAKNYAESVLHTDQLKLF